MDEINADEYIIGMDTARIDDDAVCCCVVRRKEEGYTITSQKITPVNIDKFVEIMEKYRPAFIELKK